MRNDNSFVLLIRGATLALGLLAAGCSSTPVDESSMGAVAATPMTDSMDASAEADASAATDAAARVRTDAPLRYIVKKGDTLWSIATHFLQDPWQWPEVWHVNQQVHNPHLIYPGDELLLLYVDGAPVVARSEDAPRVGKAPAAPAISDKLSPTIRERPVDQAIFTIPMDAIRAFLRGPRFVTDDELDDAPYVIAFEDDKLIAGSNSMAYVMDLEDQPKRYSQYQVVRRGRAYRDPDDNDIIGYEALPVAESEVRVIGDPSTVLLTRSDIETRAGDALLPMEDDPFAAHFVPRAPDRLIDGKIAAVYNGMSQIGQYQIVVINRGTDHGLQPGHVLYVYEAGRTVKDERSWYGRRVQMPDLHTGSVMVFKTAPRASYALIISALRPIHLLDKVEKPLTALQ